MDFNDSNWLTTKEACLYVRRTYSTLRRWVEEGKIPAPKQPTRKTRYYWKPDLDDFIRGRLDDGEFVWIEEKRRIDQKHNALHEELKQRPKWNALTPQAKQANKSLLQAMKIYSQALQARINLIVV